MVQTWRKIVSASSPATFGDENTEHDILELRCCSLLPLPDGAAAGSSRTPTLFCSQSNTAEKSAVNGGLPVSRLALARPTDNAPHCKVRARFFAEDGKLTLNVAGGGKVLVIGVVGETKDSSHDESEDGSRSAKRLRSQSAAESSSKAARTSKSPMEQKQPRMDLGLARPQAIKVQEPKPEMEMKSQGGVTYQILKQGKGEAARENNVVHVRYDGRLSSSGKRFDKGEIKFRLGIGKVIPGWDVGIKGMLCGERRKLLVPSHLGYGRKGAGKSIPPNSDLEFQCELLNSNVY
eukprot:TRINITY_DN22040_c0_g1_i1.p1 TRINITY_DN22040_c0_g1~~TRINITY_DN22040_c0_g1_i1.p1  ORF type:complete len:292 (-),score=55.69 TRINITY_DN22040_c0_g1_i1:282-1157(-)